MQAVTSLGKYLFIVPFLAFGVMHLMNANAMAGMVPIPGGALWVYVTGIAMIAAAVSILIGKMDRLATTLLGVLMLIFALGVHLPGAMNAADEMGKMMSMSGLLKDIGLAGGAWIYARAMAKE